MKLSSFLFEAKLNRIDEARRDKELAPQPEDPHAKTTPMRKKLRDVAGDVGVKDTIARVTGRAPQTGQQVRQAGKEIAKAATGVKFGSTSNAVDRALDLTRGPARHQASQFKKAELDKAKASGAIRRAPDASREERRKLRDDERAAGETKDDYDPNKEGGLSVGEYESLPLKKRMDISGSAAGEAGRLTGQKEVEDALKDARMASELPRMRNPIKVGDADIYDRPYLRHAYQDSGADLGELPTELPDFDDEAGIADYLDRVDSFLDTIQVANTDEDKPASALANPNLSIDTGGDTPKAANIPFPSLRDTQNIEAGPESAAVKRNDPAMTPEVVKHQAKMRKALSTMDSKGVQDLAFKHEVSDDVLDRFIDRFGQALRGDKLGKKKLLARIEEAGSTAPTYAKYAGEDIFDGEVPDEAKPKKADGSIDENAPPGVYDWTSLTGEQQEKAKLNRSRELVRTYLKQGGTDAYAMHEGLRAITDMDLEHIRSIKADDKEDESIGGGYDSPDNWVFASGQLNRMRRESPMQKASEKYAEGERTEGEFSAKTTKKGFEDFTKDMSKEDRNNLAGELRTIKLTDNGAVQASGPKYKKRQQKDIEADRETLMKHYGASEEQAKAIVPDREFDQDKRVLGNLVAGQDERIVGTPAAKDEKQYETDTITMQRDRAMLEKGLKKLETLFPNKSEGELMDTEEGRKMLRDIAQLPASAVDAPKPKPRLLKATPKPDTKPQPKAAKGQGYDDKSDDEKRESMLKTYRALPPNKRRGAVAIRNQLKKLGVELGPNLEIIEPQVDIGGSDEDAFL